MGTIIGKGRRAIVNGAAGTDAEAHVLTRIAPERGRRSIARVAIAFRRFVVIVSIPIVSLRRAT